MILNILVSSVLFYLAFPNIFSLQGFSFLAWIFLIPFLSCLENKNFKIRFMSGFCFGWFMNLAAINWMIPYSFPGYLLLSCVLAIQMVIFTGLYRPCSQNIIFDIFYTASAWVSSEYLRQWIMMGQSWNLAHTQTFDTTFMQITHIGSSWSVSFVLIAGNYALYRALRRGENFKNKITSIVVPASLVVFLYGYGLWSLSQRMSPVIKDEVIKVLVLQTQHDYHKELSRQDVHAIVDKNILLTRQQAVNIKPDLLIWPETAVPLDFRDEPILRIKMVSLAKELQVYFLFGAVIEDENGQHNSAVLMDPRGEIKQIYHKRHLIPLTEYIPAAWPWRFFAHVFKVKTPDLVPGSESESGLMEIQLKDHGQIIRFGVAICSEDNIARVFRDYDRQGAEFVAVLLNNGWFTQNAGFVMHGQHSIVRAIENRMTVVRSANRGLAGFIDPFGRVSPQGLYSMTHWGVYAQRIPLSGKKQGGINLHDTFCVLCLCFVIMTQLISHIKILKERLL